jgi:hypothetical protein
MTMLTAVESVAKTVAFAILKISPTIATALGSPIAGAILAGLEKKFGVSAESLSTTIQLDPDAETKLKEYESDNQVLLAQIQMQSTSLTDARAMNVATITKRGKPDWILHLMAASFTAAFFLYLICSQAHLIAFSEDIFHSLLQEESIVLLFYFGGLYKNAKSD